MAVESRINRIDELLREQCSDIVKLTASKDGLQMDMDDFKRFNEKLSDLLLLSLSDYNSNIEDQVYFERIREKYLECCADVKTRIGDLTQERLEMLSQKASNSVTSRMSRLSRASYVSSKQAAANAAALKEKMLSLKRKQNIERQQEELKHHQRELEWQVEQEQLQGEINAAEVLHQTLLGDTMLLSSNTQPTSNTLHENTTEVSQLPTITKDMNTGTSSDMTTPSNPTTPLNPTTPSNPTTPLDPTKPAFTPVNAYTQPVNHLQPTTTSPLEQMQRETFEIQRQQVELMKKMCLPTSKPPVFSGNILAYPKWMLAFDALIDDEAVNPAHKLYYLGEYTSGQAQKMIDGLLGLQSDDAYKRARQILQERFGDPYKIYQAYNERLKSWPVCSKASELQEFSDFLVTVQETMKTVKHLKDFATFSAIQDLVVRLPPYYSKKWLQNAKAVELGKGKYDFNNLVDFVQKAAKDATHPVFPHEVLLSKRKELLKDKKQEDKNSYHKRKFGSFNTSKYNESSGHRDKNTNELMCPACRKPHKLENCDIFIKKSVKE
jgi:hypothetical protein